MTALHRWLEVLRLRRQDQRCLRGRHAYSKAPGGVECDHCGDNFAFDWGMFP